MTIQVSWAALEVPVVSPPPLVQVSWAALEVPTAPPTAPSTGPPLVDSASVVSARTTTDAISLSVACTVANNANRVLVVAVGYRVPDPVRATIDGVTYGGVAMTLVGKSELTTQPTGSSLWRLVAPVVGTANVVATASASGGITIGAMCVYDAHQSTFSAPTGAASESVSSAASTTVPSAPGELVVDSVAAYAAPSLTAGTGQTERSNVDSSGSKVSGASSTAVGAASVVMSWSLSTARRWTMVGWSIKAGSATVPGAPTIGTATAGNATATVAFTPPASNGGSAITSYTVTSTPGGLTATGAASPLTVAGLTNGTSYTFKVKATNATGTGPDSAASNSVTPTGADTTPPTVSPGGRWINGSELTIAYDERLDPAFVPTPSQFTVKVNGTTRTVSTVGIEPKADDMIVTLALASAVNSSDVVTVSYVQ